MNKIGIEFLDSTILLNSSSRKKKQDCTKTAQGVVQEATPFDMIAPLKERQQEIINKYEGRGVASALELLKHLATSPMRPEPKDEKGRNKEEREARADWAEVMGLQKRIDELYEQHKEMYPERVPGSEAVEQV